MQNKMRGFFQSFAQKGSELTGSPSGFLSALALVFAWAAAGPKMGFSDAWIDSVNILTIITFWMVFLIQAEQNRDAKIARVERQAILRAISDAPDTLIGLENDTAERIDEIQAELQKARQQAEEG